MIVSEATNQHEWDTFLSKQRFRPFLQSWTMGEVYRDIGEEPVRLTISNEGHLQAICQALVVPARRGKHLVVPYGPVLEKDFGIGTLGFEQLIEALKDLAHHHKCSFIRFSPFWLSSEKNIIPGSISSPLHLLAEHVWYLPLMQHDMWRSPNSDVSTVALAEVGARTPKSEQEILMAMRKTTRNLIRRAEREGVTVEVSQDPERDLPTFLALHEETRKRHRFTPYSDAFFRAQLLRFAKRNEASLYLARHGGTVIAASMHTHAFGETSYHHGASSHQHANIPASYLLQWRAIRDALARGDHIYNFWGIAPEGARHHPFSGVTMFKRGFGGNLLELVHCMDVKLTPWYYGTRTFETLRKWKRGF